MATSWNWRLVDNLSGPADKMAGKLEKVRASLVKLQKQEEKFAQIKEQLKPQLDALSSDKARENALKKITKEMEKQDRLASKIASKESRAASRAKALAAKNSALGSSRQASAKSANMGALGAGALGLGAMAVGAGVAGFGAMASMSMDLGMQIGQAQEFRFATLNAFENILKTKKGAADAYRLAQQTAISTGSDYRESIASMNSLMAQGFDVSFADTLVKRMADLKTINPAAKLEGITRAISQIKSTGKLQGDEMMQLAEAGLNVGDVYKQIAKDMGIVEGKKNKKGQSQTAVEQVQSLQKDGKISADQAISAIMKTLENQSGGKAPGQLAMEKADKSLTGALMRADAMKQMMLESVGIDWSPITGALTRIQAVMASPVGEKFIKQLGDGFNRMLGVLDGISDKDIAATITAMGDAFTTFARVASNTADFVLDCVRAFNWFNEACKSVSDGAMNAFDVMWIMVKGVFTAMTGGLFALVEAIYDNWGAIVGFFSGIGSWLSGAASAIGGFFAGLGGSIAGIATTIWDAVTGLGTSMMDGLIGGITSGASGVVDAITNTVSSAIDAAKELLDINSPSKVMAKFGSFTSLGFAQGIEGETPAVSNASYKMAGNAIAAGASIGSAARPVSSNAPAANSNVNQVFNFHGSDAENQRNMASTMGSLALSGT